MDFREGLLFEHRTFGTVRFVREVGSALAFELFLSPWKRRQIVAIKSEVRRSPLCEQTRVYLERGENWATGRVVAIDRDDGEGYTYWVQLPNKQLDLISERSLYVRSRVSRQDPTTALAVGAMETQFWHDRRIQFGRSVVAQRAACRGLRGIISASVELVPHQVDVARRVLEDHVQRYLLADEVGMGKTIEAGFIIRQFLLTESKGDVWVVVPRNLVAQWRVELREKFAIDEFENRVVIVAAEDGSVGEAAMLVVDEVHHWVAPEVAPWLESAARRANRVLLLSATPSLREASVLLRLLRLIDPATFVDVTIDAFEARLARQEEIGIFIRGLRADANTALLRQRARRVAEVFPNDEDARNFALRIVTALDEGDRTAAATVIAQLRSHVADVYRLHHRLVRTRRREAADWVFLRRGPEPSDGGEVTIEHVHRIPLQDVTLERLLAPLEEWRVELASEFPPGSPGRDEARGVYAHLFAASWCGATAFARALQSTPDRFVSPTWRAHMGDGCAYVSVDEPARARLIAEAVRIRLRERKYSRPSEPLKVVIFGSDDEDLDACGEALRATLGARAVIDARSVSRDTDVAVVFRNDRMARVLTCDIRNEEGLNLHFANAIVHLDLPLSPQRLEQRIGRLDRFGRRDDLIEQYVVVPALPIDQSPWDAWLEVLARGFRVFNEPIAEAQFALNEAAMIAIDALFENGAQGAREAVIAVRERLDRERRTLDAQYALDRVLQQESESEGFFAELDNLDSEEEGIAAAVSGWLKRCLNLYERSEERGIVAYSWTSKTLLPKYPCQISFKSALDVLYTAQRQRAVSTTLRPRPRLMRIGAPLVNAAQGVHDWDDRGTAFATWRIVDNEDYDGLLAFKICYFVEGRLPNELSAPETAAMRARLDGFFAPSYEVLYLDANLRRIEDEALLALLQRPYLSADNGGSDYNVGSRLDALFRRIDAFRFEQLCRMAREASERQLRESRSFAAAVDSAVERGSAHFGAKLRRLRMRVSIANGEAAELARDILLIEEAQNALANPLITLDSIGAVILSNKAPGEEADG